MLISKVLSKFRFETKIRSLKIFAGEDSNDDSNISAALRLIRQ